jgi:hypothetical protein
MIIIYGFIAYLFNGGKKLICIDCESPEKRGNQGFGLGF